MTDVLNWGILGAAKFAFEQMAPAIHAARGARFYGLATSSAEKAAAFKAFQPDLAVYDTNEDLLADPQIDAVYIPLPNHLHVEWTLKALEAGKHVLTEKPIAMSAPEIDTLIARRDETGLLAAEAYMIVHHPQWLRVRQLVQGGVIGKLMHVDGIFTYNNESDPSNFRNSAQCGGGGVPDIGVYTYGSTRFVSGEEVSRITQADLDFENGVDVVACVSARFQTFTASWVNSMRMHPMQTMSFIGKKGIIRLNAPFNPMTFDGAELELHVDGLKVEVERFPKENQYVLQVEAFGRSAIGKEPYAWPLEQARGTQALIDEVFAKASNQREE